MRSETLRVGVGVGVGFLVRAAVHRLPPVRNLTMMDSVSGSSGERKKRGFARARARTHTHTHAHICACTHTQNLIRGRCADIRLAVTRNERACGFSYGNKTHVN